MQHIKVRGVPQPRRNFLKKYLKMGITVSVSKWTEPRASIPGGLTRPLHLDFFLFNGRVVPINIETLRLFSKVS